MKTPAKQLAMVRDWERRHPKQAQARKNAYWKTEKGKAAIKRRRKKFNAYRRRWRAQRAKAKAANKEVSDGRRGHSLHRLVGRPVEGKKISENSSGRDSAIVIN